MGLHAARRAAARSRTTAPSTASPACTRRGSSRSCPTSPRGIYLRYNQDPGVLNGTQLYGNIGADLKVGLTPALTLDATINPDFGQVEADQVVLNLSTFEVFFPEKRPFFLEGVDIFATQLNLFYSRRIGHAPPLPDSDNYTAPRAAACRGASTPPPSCRGWSRRA